MLLNQISVFLENRPGTLSSFVQLLADNRIDLEALSIAEAQDYGILRIIVDRPEETAALIEQAGWPCAITPVLAVTVPDEPGSLTRLLAILAEQNISLSYSYAFLSRVQGNACIVLRVDDNEAAIRALDRVGIQA